MTKPLVIMVGADKGGVGKTTVSRALDDYIREREAVARVYDGQHPKGDLKQFVPASEVVDLQSLDDQMKIFDRLRGVVLIDIKGGLFSEVLETLIRTGMLDDVRAGVFNLLLLHVLGPSAASLAEISEIAGKLGGGARHILVRNYVNESGFKEWEADPRFAQALAGVRNIAIPHLEGRACTEVQQLGMSFSAFADDRQRSRMLRGYVRDWRQAVFAGFDAVGIDQLIGETR
jgi:hypothetical protein